MVNTIRSSESCRSIFNTLLIWIKSAKSKKGTWTWSSQGSRSIYEAVFEISWHNVLLRREWRWGKLRKASMHMVAVMRCWKLRLWSSHHNSSKEQMRLLTSTDLYSKSMLVLKSRLEEERECILVRWEIGKVKNKNKIKLKISNLVTRNKCNKKWSLQEMRCKGIMEK